MKNVPYRKQNTNGQRLDFIFGILPEKTSFKIDETGNARRGKRIQEKQAKGESQGQKKKVNWEDFKGGAIETSVRLAEAPVPEPEPDYREMPRDHGFLYQGPKYEFYRDAYDYRPRNIQPMSAYEPFLSSRNEAFHRDLLKQGLSGFGARRDDNDIMRATVHSLKRHPELLVIYTEGVAL